jgi:hypothetical protein
MRAYEIEKVHLSVKSVKNKSEKMKQAAVENFLIQGETAKLE